MGAIEKCVQCSTQFVSNIFLRRKTNGKKRLILNNLNKCVLAPHFKIEDFRTAKKLLYKVVVLWLPLYF